jgi:hypothetical protein
MLHVLRIAKIENNLVFLLFGKAVKGQVYVNVIEPSGGITGAMSKVWRNLGRKGELSRKTGKKGVSKKLLF